MGNIRWSVLNPDNKANAKCMVCGKACVPKDVGNICVECLECIPNHIPVEQTHKYLQKIQEKKK